MEIRTSFFQLKKIISPEAKKNETFRNFSVIRVTRRE